ncbi:MAG: DUF1992 domain-containing protein [Planctomycetes bacterium]|nr:DUF1992 domain-containing protein [Planctomycetota bacterium]
MGWYLFVERLISEAQERGEFDRLPGAGKPLRLAENPFEPADWRLANKLLKDNELLPEFLERRKSIEAIAGRAEDLLRVHDRQYHQLTAECSKRMRDLFLLFPDGSQLLGFLGGLPLEAAEFGRSRAARPPAG